MNKDKNLKNNKLTTFERRKEMLRIIQDKGSARVSTFQQDYFVSSVTIRNDLAVLEKQGTIIRFHGGARLNPEYIFQPQSDNKIKPYHQKPSHLLAKIAAKLLKDGDTIFLDSNTMMVHIIPYINKALKITVMTYDLAIAYQLSYLSNVTLIVLGGKLQTKSRALVCHMRESQLRHYRFNKLFLAVESIDIDAGITTSTPYKARLLQEAISISNQIITIVESTTYNHQQLYSICKLRDVDTLITYNIIPERYREAFIASGINLLTTE